MLHSIVDLVDSAGGRFQQAATRYDGVKLMGDRLLGQQTVHCIHAILQLLVDMLELRQFIDRMLHTSFPLYNFIIVNCKLC